MKKVVCLLLALVLCFSLAALAGGNTSAPSITVDDLTGYGAERFVVTVGDLDARKVASDELAKLQAAKSLESYFGPVASFDGLTLSEFQTIFVSGYDTSMGNAKVKMQFPTPYEKGEQVLVLIGIVGTNAQGSQEVKWTAFDGVGTGDSNSTIKTTLSSNILLAIQEGVALVAVLNK